MQDHWDLGRWRGVPVSMHWTVLLAFPWLYLWTRSLLGAAIGSVAFLALCIAHEFGHVWAARRRRIPVNAVTLSGMHGETDRGFARTQQDEVFVAWAGVGAQMLILIFALIAGQLLGYVGNPLVWLVAGPIIAVWTHWNVFLMIIALLPIGPMDGHAAWRIIAIIKSKFRKKKVGEKKPAKLSAERQRELEADSERKVVEIIDRLKRK